MARGIGGHPLPHPKHLRIYREPMGRPSEYDAEVAASLCDKLSMGDLLIDICAQSGMPALTTVYRWQDAHPEFRETYARARKMQAHARAEMAVKAGDDANADNSSAKRLKFDASRWLAARLDPANYADRVKNDIQALDKDGKPADAQPLVVQFVAAKDGKPA